MSARAAIAMLAAALAMPAAADTRRVSPPALAPEATRLFDGGAAPLAPLSPAVRGALAGRSAGAPVACIDQRRPLAVRILDRTAILWEIDPRRWYLNRPVPACAALAPDRILVTRTGDGQVCRGDRVTVVGTPDGEPRGSCRLGPFVPYTR